VLAARITSMAVQGAGIAGGLACLVGFGWLLSDFAVTPAPGPVSARAQALSWAMREGRAKGHARLVIFRKHKKDVERLRSGLRIRAGDLIQLGYVAADQPFGVIFSVDGRKKVTLHYPPHVAGPTVLAPGGLRYLPYAFELDDAPDFERVIFVTGGQPLDVRAVLAAARRLAQDRPLSLPSGAQVAQEILLRK
jgi:hypothetical protein